MSSPFSNNFSQDYDTDDDPLLYYCEDYVWDPSDWELETEDSNAKWDLSDNDHQVLLISPPQSCTTPTVGHTTSRPGSIAARIYTMLLKYCIVMKKALTFRIIKRKWGFFKWVFVVLNVMVEVCQAMFSQENAQGKISTRVYLKSSVITSAFCLLISLLETIHEGKRSKVVWQKMGCCCFGWFYYPGKKKRLFGRFSLILGVISSTVQFCVNVVALVISNNYLAFDTLPLLLSSGYFVAALVNGRGGDAIRSRVHGRRSSRKAKMVDKFGSNGSIQTTKFDEESNGLISDDFKTIQIGSYPNLLSINVVLQ